MTVLWWYKCGIIASNRCVYKKRRDNVIYYIYLCFVYITVSDHST